MITPETNSVITDLLRCTERTFVSHLASAGCTDTSTSVMCRCRCVAVRHLRSAFLVYRHPRLTLDREMYAVQVYVHLDDSLQIACWIEHSFFRPAFHATSSLVSISRESLQAVGRSALRLQHISRRLKNAASRDTSTVETQCYKVIICMERTCAAAIEGESLFS